MHNCTNNRYFIYSWVYKADGVLLSPGGQAQGQLLTLKMQNSRMMWPRIFKWILRDTSTKDLGRVWISETLTWRSSFLKIKWYLPVLLLSEIKNKWCDVLTFILTHYTTWNEKAFLFWFRVKFWLTLDGYNWYHLATQVINLSDTNKSASWWGAR